MVPSPTVILKYEKHDHTELFDTELEAYAHLIALQGTIVPKCYCLASHKNQRCLILQDIGGVSLGEPAGLTLELSGLSTLLKDCHLKLHANGVHQEDPQLDNFRLVGDRLMAVDFERVAFNLSREEKALFMTTNIEHMATRYRDMQIGLWKEGILESI